MVPNFVLNTGAIVPGLGFGTGTVQDVNEIKRAVLQAIKIGYRHFDTAAIYGTEVALGKALTEAFDLGLVKREDVFITTKLKHDDHDREAVVPALKESLSKLGVEYVDLFLIHGPFKTTKGAKFPPKEHEFLPLDIPSTWKGMEECMDRKLARSIGVSNFTTKKLKDLLKTARVCPAANQVELHPVWQQKKLRDFCKSNGIQVFAWSPLGGVGKPWGSVCVIEHPIVKKIATKYNKTPAQVVFRWLTDVGVVPVMKSYNLSRLNENIASFDFELSPDDHYLMETIEQKRLGTWELLCNSTTSPYRSPIELWDGEI